MVGGHRMGIYSIPSKLKDPKNSPAPLGFAVTGAVSCSALAQEGKDLSYP